MPRLDPNSLDRLALPRLAIALVTAPPILALRTPICRAANRSMQAFRDGNYKDAYDGLRRLLVARDANNCHDRRRSFDRDPLLAATQSRRRNRRALASRRSPPIRRDWRLLAAVAQSYTTIEHYGFMIAGEFHRGQHRGGGRVVHATARDRVRALQLFLQAMNVAERGQ